MNETNYMENPIDFLLQSGLLFEINRQILHPFGLALAVYEAGAESTDTGLISLIDSRDDEEGFVYAPDTFLSGLSKVNAFLEEFGIEKLKERKNVLGFVTQEHPEPHLKKEGVTLITYGLDQEEGASPTMGFKVPFDWLADILEEREYGLNVYEFLDQYSYDDSLILFEEAMEEGILLK